MPNIFDSLGDLNLALPRLFDTGGQDKGYVDYPIVIPAKKSLKWVLPSLLVGLFLFFVLRGKK